MQRIFTFLSCLLFISITKSSAQLTCEGTAGASATYVSGGQTFTTAAWGSTNGNFTYSGASQNYQAVTAANSTAVITSPFFTAPGGSLIVGARIAPGNRVEDYTISILESGAVIACFNGTALSTGNPVGIAASFSDLGGKTIQVRFTFVTPTNQGATLIFDDFLSNPELTPLPVTFISFNAEKLSSNTKLTWKVGTEENLKGYEIEKSTDGRQFTSIGFVQANGQSTYTFSDAQISQGAVFYRIRNVDNDGQFKYSNILSLKNGTSSLVLKAFPLPVVNNLTIQHEAIFNNGTINITSSDGRIVRRIIPAAGSLETVVNLSALKSGIYILHFDSGNGKLQSMKFMKQ
jgi:hypothetical protein